ncbi:hypothetical protein Aperf_G00000043979 [Anoplocephala perfoliata]
MEDISFNKLGSISWPVLVDFSSADCRRLLRRHEIEAYAKVVTAFRAQGLLTKEKRSLLFDLQRLLSINGDRHRAEVRRAVNDEELATISRCICGKSTDDSWVSEGRRIAPIIRRGVPQTAFLLEADAVAKKIASYNFGMPKKCERTGTSAERVEANEKPDTVPSAKPIECVNKPENEGSVLNDDSSLLELLRGISNDAAALSTVVPEAAVEVTCEAHISKSKPFISGTEEKTSLIADSPLEQVPHQVHTAMIPPHIEESQHTVPLVKPKPIIQAVMSGVKRTHSIIETPYSTSFTSMQPSLQKTSVEGTKNGVVPLISNRNIIIRPNNPHIPNSTSKSVSQGMQMGRIPSVTPVMSVSVLNRPTPAAVSSSAPCLTTVVMTGSAGTPAYISQPSRVIKNYPSVITYQQNTASSPSTQLPASNILADNKKMHLYQQKQQQNPQLSHPTHPILVQSSQQAPKTPIPNSPSGNVFVVQRCSANRLVTSCSTVTCPSAAICSPALSSTSRPLRILPLNNSLITTTANSTTLAPLLSAANLQPHNHHQQQQTNLRITTPTTLVSGDSELSAGGVNLVKMTISSGTGHSTGNLLSSSSSAHISNVPSTSQVEHIEEIESLGKSLSKVPWNSADVDVFVSHLRHLRTEFGSASSPSSEKIDISQEICAKTLSVLSSLLKTLLTPESRDFLDQTEGRDHLVLSVLLQCMVNSHSYMKTYKMPTSGEITATVTAILLYDTNVCNWVYSLNSIGPLSLWRARIGYSAFVLITELITAASLSGIHPDFTRFLDHATQCMRLLFVNGGENVLLIQNWYDHTILLISSLCNVSPREAYWQHASKRLERAVQLSSALGTILLLHDYEDGFKEIETPSMIKLAELCINVCAPLINQSSEAWLDSVMSILKHCITKAPFQICHKQDSQKTSELLEQQLSEGNVPRMLGILRGAAYLTLHLLPPVEDPPQTKWSMMDDDRLSELIFTIGDLMVLMDSLLQAHLSKQEPIGRQGKAPSLMNSMGVFNFNQPRSICFAVFLKQELIRSLLSIIYYRPQMVPCFVKHPRVTGIECSFPPSTIPVNAPDMFWALVNSSQRDPHAATAVEYTIVLLSRLLKPDLQTNEVLQASATLAQHSSHMTCLLAQPTEAALFNKVLKVYPDFDAMVVKPLLDIAKLEPPSIINLLRVALSSDLPCASSDSYCLEMRLQMMKPEFVLTKVVNPLMRFGVTNPRRLIRRCPSLFVAAAMRDGEHTRLLVALSTLNSLLTRKELAAVVKNFPSVLTRSREDLERTYDYLTQVMGLEGSRFMAATRAGSSRNVHENRHSTRLRLITSPAWRLSLRRTIARHTLLLFAAQWPPSLPRPVNRSREYIVGQLLRCSPNKFSYWLEYHDDSVSEDIDGSSFSSADVQHFEKICENLGSEAAVEFDDEGASFEEDYSQIDSETED